MRHPTRSSGIATHSTMHRKLAATLTTWPFVASLLLLLVNDAWLKAAYPGLLTGKLSDVAGTAVVTLLLLTVLPHRPGLVYAGMAAAFAWWKSPLSPPFLDAANALLPVTLGRVVDYTDLLALCVMPLCRPVVAGPGAYAMPGPWMRRLLVAPMVALTLFGLMATSVLPLTRQEYVIRRADPAAARHPGRGRRPWSRGAPIRVHRRARPGHA